MQRFLHFYFRITILCMGDTIDGIPVTEDQIQRLVKKAERGYPVEQLRKRGRRPSGDGPGRVVSVRMDESMIRAVESRAKRDAKSDSEVIREALRAWL
jgi:hypothetical protein